MASSEHQQRPGHARDFSDDLGQELAISSATPSSSQPATPRTHYQRFHLPNLSADFNPGIRPFAQSGYFSGDASERSSIVGGNPLGAAFNFNSPSVSTRDSFMSPPIRPTNTYQSLYTTTAPPKLTKPSTMLTNEVEKPWKSGNDSQLRIAYWIAYATAALGIVASVLRCYYGWKSVQVIGNICQVMEDEFETLNTDIWSHDIDLGGFGCVTPFYSTPRYLST